MSFEECRELSAIVPVFNEEGNIAFLRAIGEQRELCLELIVSDGASTDDSIGAVQRFAQRAPFPVRVIGGAKEGRGS